MTDSTPPPSLDEVNSALADEDDEGLTEESTEPTETDETTEPTETPADTKPEKQPETDSEVSAREIASSLSSKPSGPSPDEIRTGTTRSIQAGILALFGGVAAMGVATGYILYDQGFALALSATVTLAIAGVAAGSALLTRHLLRRADRRHAELLIAIEEASGFGLPGLDEEQKKQLSRHQELIDAVMNELPEQQSHLRALERSLPTQEEQVLRVAESQREIWEEIEEEFR